MVEIQDLHVAFGDFKVLNGVDLTIRDGETVTVIGGSGTGKSVLLKVVMGLMQPDRGCAKINGRELWSLPWRENVIERMRSSMLFQGGALFDSLTVGENVAFPARLHTQWDEDEISRMVGERLAMVGLPGIQDKKPAELSGGMKKRVALARAIALSPQLLLYDEPTTGLDPIMSDVINELILKMQRQMSATSIVVTHDMASAYKVSDRIVMLYKGRIIDDKSPDEIKESDNPVVKQFINGLSTGPF